MRLQIVRFTSQSVDCKAKYTPKLHSVDESLHRFTVVSLDAFAKMCLKNFSDNKDFLPFAKNKKCPSCC